MLSVIRVHTSFRRPSCYRSSHLSFNLSGHLPPSLLTLPGVAPSALRLFALLPLFSRCDSLYPVTSGHFSIPEQ